MELLQRLTNQACQGEPVSVDDALALNDRYTTDQLAEAADRVRAARQGDDFDTCSIINARSGRCTEDCKWCAQSRYHTTGVDEYEMVDREELMSMVDRNTARGVRRFSMVTSGRRVSRGDIKRFCELYREIGSRSSLRLCASMGLLDKESLQQLHDAGVSRYHCNLETSASYFPELCTTHTREDKLRTIRAAREVGMEVCAGGIIGMGETLRQRLEMIAEAREAGAVSMPINLLNPIPGTALEGTPLLDEEEVVRSVALMRLVAPDCAIRFAGGRARVSEASTRRMLRGGVNGCLVGDMLTTVGNKMDRDFELFRSQGYKSLSNNKC